MKYEYCPNGNHWTDVSGVFDSRTYYFCDCKYCKGRLYELRPTDVTKKLGEEAIDLSRKKCRREKVSRLVNFNNMEEVAKIVEKDGDF